MIVPEVADAAKAGLTAEQKWLPSWLLYDEAGCALYDQITHLSEYYLTRAEAEIFEQRGDAIVALAAGSAPHEAPPPEVARLAFCELGAGTATKTEALLRAALRAQDRCVYLACDISEGSLRKARRRLAQKLPGVEVRTHTGTHAGAGPALAGLIERQVLLFIGSSIGNYTDTDAVRLLADMRRFLRSDAVLVLGTDIAKNPQVMLRAYDDAQGVTAAFSKNMLVRLNREIDARFDVDDFQHVALWNEAASNIEIYLECRRAQRVWVGAFGHELSFREGERIHTETCAKYDCRRIDRILSGGGFERITTLFDSARSFGVQIARAA